MIWRIYRTTFEDIDGVDLQANAIDVFAALSLSRAYNTRYAFRSLSLRDGKAEEVFEKDLEEDELEQQKWLNDDEFLSKYRMSRSSFNKILAMIKDHPIFQSKTRKQRPVKYQLMVWLRYAGSEGSGGSNANQRNTFRIGYGTADAYRRRVTIAIRSLKYKYLYWPDEEERLEISRQIFKEYDFPHCVGIADGTLFILAFEPETLDAPDYSGRKYGYSLTTMIICDHKRRVRHYLAGFPGSAHDNRVYKATKLYRNPNDYFSNREYVIGDSAFTNTNHMVSAFKKPKGESIPKSHEAFNEKLAKLRIISEHCIGILKGRFPWLRSIRLKIKEDPKSIKNILDMIDATIIMHNILIELGEEEKREWIDEDDCSLIGDAEPYQDGDALNTAIPQGAAQDERRTRLMHYLEEHHYFV